MTISPAASFDQILFLSPDLGEQSIGGIQASGRDAWAGLRSLASTGQARLFLVSLPEGESSRLQRILAKAALLITAAREPARQDRLLFWHIGLLKLLPFFRSQRAKVALFLHGVEVWRRHDALTRLLLLRVDLFLSNSDYTWCRMLAHYPRLHACTATYGSPWAWRVRIRNTQAQ